MLESWFGYKDEIDELQLHKIFQPSAVSSLEERSRVGAFVHDKFNIVHICNSWPIVSLEETHIGHCSLVVFYAWRASEPFHMAKFCVVDIIA